MVKGEGDEGIENPGGWVSGTLSPGMDAGEEVLGTSVGAH